MKRKLVLAIQAALAALTLFWAAPSGSALAVTPNSVAFRASAHTSGGDTLTIPGTVQAGDVILIMVEAYDANDTGGTLSLSSNGTTQPVQVGSSTSWTDGTGLGALDEIQLWKLTVATGDPGAVLTIAHGSPGTWNNWAAGLGAWSGVSGIDVTSAGHIAAGSESTSWTAPSATTTVSGDWGVYLAGTMFTNYSITGNPGTLRSSAGSPPTSWVDIADSNGSLGTASTAFGGGTWTSSVSSPWGGYTVGLKPFPPAAVTVCGTAFCRNGSSFYPYGASFYDSTSSSGILGNPSGAISLALAQHLNTVRVVNWLSHSASVAAATQNSTWTPVDAFIGDAQAAGLYSWLDLSDFKVVLMKNCLNPYTDLSDWYTLIDYAASRVNSATGASYKSDPELTWVGFAGEPQEADKYYTRTGAGNQSGSDAANAAPESNWGTASSACSSPLYYSTSDLTTYYTDVEKRWKSTDGASVPTMPGGLSKLDLPSNGNIDYQSIFSNPYNDICGFKTYGGMESWLSTGTSYCASIGKPSVNVEWGYQQGTSDSARASSFAGQFSNNSSAGIAANFYWNAGYQSSSTGYDVDDGTSFPLTEGEIVSNAP